MQTFQHTHPRSGSKVALHLGLAALALRLLAGSCCADIIEMANGDHYSGTVLSVNLTNVAVRGEIQGTITLPRAKVARISFGNLAVAAPIANRRMPAAVPVSGVPVSGVPATRGLDQLVQAKGADTNAVARLQKDVLAQAGPEAARKYSELSRGLLSGSVTVNDLRKQAQQIIAEAEAMKQDQSPEVTEILDSYLEILQRFVGDPSESGTKP